MARGAAGRARGIARAQGPGGYVVIVGILPDVETHTHDAARMGAARRPAPYPPDTAAAQAHRTENAPRPAGAKRRARSALGLRMVRDARVRARFALVEIARAGPDAFRT